MEAIIRKELTGQSWTRVRGVELIPLVTAEYDGTLLGFVSAVGAALRHRSVVLPTEVNATLRELCNESMFHRLGLARAASLQLTWDTRPLVVLHNTACPAASTLVSINMDVIERAVWMHAVRRRGYAYAALVGVAGAAVALGVWKVMRRV